MEQNEASVSSLTRDDVNIRCALHLAARQGRVGKLYRLLSSGDVSVDAVDEHGNTPLHVAVAASRTDAVRLLVSSHADISRRNLADQTPLDICLRENLTEHRDKYEIINILVSVAAQATLGASFDGSRDVHADDVNTRELGYADDSAVQSNVEDLPMRSDGIPRNQVKHIAPVLSKSEASSYRVSSGRWRGSESGSLPAMSDSRLVRSKAESTTVDYWKTMSRAPRRLTRNLGNYFASSETESLPENRCPSIASGFSAECLNEFSCSLLHLAVIGGTVQVIKSLLIRPIDVNMRDVDGQSPLHLAVVSGRTRVTSMLLRHGACANAADRRNRRPLHLAAVLPSGGLCQMLLRHSADVNAADESGVTSLHCAAKVGQRQTVKLLIDGGAAVNLADVRRQQPIHIATGRGSFDTVELLLWRGSQVNAADDKGKTPLHLAAVTSSGVDIVRVLILHDACVNVPDADGRTSLHLACAAGRADVVRTLLNRGADVNARDHHGACAYQLALRYGRVTSVIRCHVTNATLYASRLHETREAEWRSRRGERQEGRVVVMASPTVGERLARHKRAPRRRSSKTASATGRQVKKSKHSHAAAKNEQRATRSCDRCTAKPTKPCCVTM